ncbi:MAG: hypothetical protein PVF83_01030 [Anaerolineales bacterium]|jgi:PTS system galactitol-specific IIB component
MSKKVLVLCATSIATSTAVAARIREVCKEKKIDIEVTQGKVGDYMGFGISSNTDREKYDLVITTVEIPKDKFRVPILHGHPILSGIGEKELLAKILKILTASHPEI